VRILDLFCCQGGAGTGYHRAGFDVVGVDIDPQPNYPFRFHQGDALVVLRDLLLSDILGTPVRLGGEEYVLQDFDAIHASPPCQAYSTITPDKSKHPELIGPVREFLTESGLPYVIENVDGAKRELVDPVMLCGSSFGLRVRRHRWFESNIPIMSMPCQHAAQGQPVGVYGDHPDKKQVLRPDGRSRGAKATSVDDARDAMGMPWADWVGCAEAIPPAYTEWIGKQLLEHVRAEGVSSVG
jgi:DNA (cytosine-5)-methyltransferase 1